MIWRENDKNKRQKKKKYDKKMTEIDRQSQMEYSVQRKEKQMYMSVSRNVNKKM